MAMQLLFLFIGLAIIIKGGDLFVSAAIRIAEHLRLPKVVIGSTLVSLATTTPELVVSIMAFAVLLAPASERFLQQSSKRELFLRNAHQQLRQCLHRGLEAKMTKTFI